MATSRRSREPKDEEGASAAAAAVRRVALVAPPVQQPFVVTLASAAVTSAIVLFGASVVPNGILPYTDQLFLLLVLTFLVGLTLSALAEGVRRGYVAGGSRSRFLPGIGLVLYLAITFTIGVFVGLLIAFLTDPFFAPGSTANWPTYVACIAVGITLALALLTRNSFAMLLAAPRGGEK